jgi:DNA replication protein DnaC
MDQLPKPIDFTGPLERLRTEHGVTLPHGDRYLYTINGGTPFTDRADKDRIETAYFTGTLNNKRQYQPAVYSLFEGGKIPKDILSEWDVAKQRNVELAKKVKQQALNIGTKIVASLANGEPATGAYVFYGDYGTGKSKLAKALYNDIQGSKNAAVSAVFVSAIALYELFQRTYTDEAAKQRWEFVFKAIDDADLFILDDAGTELADTKTNAAVQQYMRRIAGLREGKLILITTNDKPDVLATKYGGATVSRMYTKNPANMVSFVGLDDVRNR